jgi:uncharacterized protein (UPF0332 family)
MLATIHFSSLPHQLRLSRALIKNWLLKSDEAMVDAKLTLEQDRLSNTQNRLYYAIFYAVSGLGQKLGFVTSKHAQLLGWFNREFLKTGKIDIKYGKLYKKCYNDRQKNDYTFTFKPKKEVLLDDISEAEEFINVIKELAQKDD